MVVASSSLPLFGLGLAALGRPGYINIGRNDIFDEKDANMNDVQRRSVESMQNKANDVMSSLVSLAHDNDTKPWFDCARSYGLSEKFVGDFLRDKKINPSDVYVSSKWGYTYVADWKIELESGSPHEIKDHSIQNFLKQIEETKEHVGDYLNLYQVHSATFESGILTDKRVHDALASTREELGCRIGLSVSSPNQDDIIREAMQIKVNGQRLFDAVQCTFNLFEQRPASALLMARNAGMDIIIKEGIANGRILSDSKVRQLAADEHDCTPDALALAFILAQPFQPRVLSGAVTSEQLSSNAKALELARKLSKEDLERMGELCARDSNEYWAERASLNWN